MTSYLRRFALAIVVPAAIAAGCGSSGGTNTNTVQSSAPATSTTQYHAGEHCRPKQSVVYAAKGFACVNGTLRHKSTGAPPTKTHKTHTVTAAPQGY